MLAGQLASWDHDVIGRSHSQGSGLPPAFLDIVVVFALSLSSLRR